MSKSKRWYDSCEETHYEVELRDADDSICETIAFECRTDELDERIEELRCFYPEYTMQLFKLVRRHVSLP